MQRSVDAFTGVRQRLHVLAILVFLLGSCGRPTQFEKAPQNAQHLPRNLIYEEGTVGCPRFSPDGQVLAFLTRSRGEMHGISGWRHREPQSPFPIQVIRDPEEYLGLWWQDDRNLLVLRSASRELTLESWNVLRGTRNWTTAGADLLNGWCFPLKSGEEILTVGYTLDMGDECDICILDGRTGTIKRDLGRYGYPRSASVAGNGSRFCVVADGRRIHVWDMSPDGEHIASVRKGVVEIIDGPAALQDVN